MKIPNRPAIKDAEVDKLAAYFFPSGPPPLLLIAIRGYFLNTVGKPGKNDLNVYDDGLIVYEEGSLVRTFNWNTDPSKAGARLAMLDEGVYQFAKGWHKKRIRGFRAYPEGVRLPCTRDGVKSFCSAINIHDGGAGTWSEGCQTTFQPQFNEMRDLVYGLMDKHGLSIVTYLLTSEARMRQILAA